ncbi:MAG: AmpG family muropeptide MFS transporter [Gammaproteobacteria bacterium]|nr:AmpG family muropeptide MFS transporter [Gammaproteobacteria bacterium]
MVQAYLAQSRWLRLTSFTAFYFAQGVPIGLLTIALPAWLSERGMSLGEIAGYQAVVGLPWGFKLIAGPFMDRFSFPAMGRRRPWVMAAQGGLTLALASLAVVSDPLSQLPLVIALAFMVNAFAAVQDVAVDGMAIDVLPESERGRANALMAFGQVAGFSVFTALAGSLLSHYGMATAALCCAATVGSVFILITLVRERPGERLLPWSAGIAAVGGPLVRPTFAGIFKGLAGVLLLPMSIVLTLAEVAVRMRDGISISVQPVTATQVLGYTTVEYANLQGVMGLAVAAIGILVGPLVDRFGIKRLFLIGIGGSALTTFAFALAEPLWSNTTFVVGMAAAVALFSQVAFVCFIAAAMMICWGPVAASQFAIYMSLANLARSAGSAAFAPFADQLEPASQFLLMSALMVVAFALVLLFRPESHKARLRALDESLKAAG